MNKGFIKALLPLFVLVFFTLPFVSCGGGDSSSSSSDNGGSGNYISLVGQWEEINVDESETYPMKTRYTFLNDATCYEDLYIKIGNKYSRNSRTEYTWAYDPTRSVLTLINMERLDANGNLIYRYASVEMDGSVLNLYWTDGIHEELMKL